MNEYLQGRAGCFFLKALSIDIINLSNMNSLKKGVMDVGGN